jgi:uncharacterized protein YciI
LSCGSIRLRQEERLGPTADHDPDALDVLDSSFRLLVSGPSPLAIDGAALGHGLPARLIPARSAPRDTDDGLVFRVEADTAEQAASQVIGMVGDVGVIGAIYPADGILAAASRSLPSMAPSIRAFRPC